MEGVEVRKSDRGKMLCGNIPHFQLFYIYNVISKQNTSLFDLHFQATGGKVNKSQNNYLYQHPIILILCGHARMLPGAGSLCIRFEGLIIQDSIIGVIASHTPLNSGLNILCSDRTRFLAVMLCQTTLLVIKLSFYNA